MRERRRRKDPTRQSIRANKPCEKRVREVRGNNCVCRIHRHTSPRRHRCLRLQCSFAKKQPFKRSIDKLEIDRLRARPSAPDTAEQCGQQEDANKDRDEEQCEEKCLGRTKDRTEEHELTVHDIEQNRGETIDLRPRDQCKDHDQCPRHSTPTLPPLSR